MLLSKSHLGEVADHSLVCDFFPAKVLDIEGSYLHCDSCSNCGGRKKKGRDAEEAETDEVKCGKVRALWVVSDENKDVS